MDYIHKNIEDMTLPELKELCENPEKYNITFGEYMKLIDAVQRAKEINKPAQASGSWSKDEIEKLKLRVTRLEQALANMTKLFADVHASLEE